MKIRMIANNLMAAVLMMLMESANALAASGGSAQDVMDATNDFTATTLKIFKGPVVKILAGVVLFVGVGGLLRGKHQVAVSCGVAFILLLFLPIILQYFGG